MVYALYDIAKMDDIFNWLGNILISCFVWQRFSQRYASKDITQRYFYWYQWRIWGATQQNQQSDCAPSEHSDQPGHPPSLIRVFAVLMKKAWVLSTEHTAKTDQTGRMPRLIWVFTGRTLILLVLSCRGSYPIVLNQNRNTAFIWPIDVCFSLMNK